MTTCPHCTNTDERMMELLVKQLTWNMYLCFVCGKKFVIKG